VWRFKVLRRVSPEGEAIKDEVVDDTSRTVAPTPIVADRPSAWTRNGDTDVRAIKHWIAVRIDFTHF